MQEIRLHPEAEAEADAAARWYESKQRELGTVFLDDLDHAIAVIAESPELWRYWPMVKRSMRVRRALLPRFPYAIAYIVDRNGIVIVAIAHLSRRPRYWQVRLEN